MFDGMRLCDSFRGAIIGSAVGDALGAPVEFLSLQLIRAEYDAEGIQGYVSLKETNGEAIAPYSDDTQMAEAVTLGILEEDQSKELAMETLVRRFVEWKKNPQGGHRAPGGACLAGAQRLASGIVWRETGGTNSGGCGSVMRAYPFGLIFHDDFEKAIDWAAEHSLMTHRAPIAIAACAAMSVATAMAVNRAPVSYILTAMIQASARYSTETSYMLERAANTPREKESMIKNWYEGWAAHEAIAISAFLFKTHYDRPYEAILSAVNTSGDSDSIGSIVGALVGAYQGIGAIPVSLVSSLERHNNLMSLADLCVSNVQQRTTQNVAKI